MGSEAKLKKGTIQMELARFSYSFTVTRDYEQFILWQLYQFC